MSDQQSSYTVSNVLDSFKVNKFTWYMFFILGFAMVFDGYDYMIVSYTLQKISATWSLDPVLTGSLSSWGLFGLIIGGAISGILSDKFGRKKTLVGAIFIYSLLTLPQAFAPNFYFFAVFRMLAGVGLGACIPTVSTCYTELTPTNRRGAFITAGQAWMISGWVLAGVVGNFITNNPTQFIEGFENWRLCYLIGAAPLLYSILLLFIMHETPHWYANKGRKEEALERLAYIEKVAFGKVTKRDPQLLLVPPKPKKTGPAALFSKNYLFATLAVWTCYFIGCFIVYGINAWLPTIMSANFGASGGATLATWQNAAAILSNLSVGFVAELVGRKKSLMTGFVISMIAVLISSWAVGTSDPSFLLTLVIMIFFGFAVNFTITCVSLMMAEAYPTEFRNTGVSWCQAFGRLGGAISPMILGMVLVATNSNYSQAFLFLLVPCILGLVCAGVFVRRETRGKSLEELQSEAEETAVTNA